MPVSWATRAGMRGFASMPNATRPLQTAKMAPCRSGRLGADPLKILFLTNAHNGLSQRARGMLHAQGHTVSVELAISQKQIKAVVDDARPDVIICPFLTARVPEEIWKKGYPKPDTPVIIVQPGVQGDKARVCRCYVIFCHSTARLNHICSACHLTRRVTRRFVARLFVSFSPSGHVVDRLGA